MAVITEITAQKKKKDRCNIFVDGAFFCGLQAETVMKYRLKAGTAVAAEELEAMQMESERLQAFDCALNFLSNAMKTKRQIADHLEKKGYLGGVIEACLEKLEYYGYQDDGAYAKAYVKAYGEKKGERLMRCELFQKGIAPEEIDRALEDAEDRQLSGARATAEKYYARRRGEENAVQKTYRYLLSKGYAYEICKQAIRGLEEEACDAY